MADKGNEKPKEQPAPDAAPPDRDPAVPHPPSSSANTSNETSAIEQQLSGAVRRAVTDVMKTNQKQPSLPVIDMNFVAGADQPETAPAHDNENSSSELTKPGSAEGLSYRSPSVQTDASAPIQQTRSKSMLIGVSAAVAISAIILALVFGRAIPYPDSDASTVNAASTAAPDVTSGSIDAARQTTSSERESRVAREIQRRIKQQQQEVAELKAAAAGERLLLEAKLEANRAALAKAEERAARQQRQSTSQNISTDAERRLLEAQLAAKRAALAEAESRAFLTQREAAEQKAATQADRLLLETKRAAVEEAERRIALQREVAAEQRAEAQAERLLLEAKQAAIEAAANRLAQQRKEASRRKAAADAAEARLSKLRSAPPSTSPNAARQNGAAPVNPKPVSGTDSRRLNALRAAEQDVEKYRAAELAAIEQLRQASKEARLTHSAVAPDKVPQQSPPATNDADGNQPPQKMAAINSQGSKPHSDPLPSATSSATSENAFSPSWFEEEKVRLRLEQLLITAAKEAAVSTPGLRTGPLLARRAVTLQLKNSNLTISGELKSHDGKFFVILLPTREEISLPAEYFDCKGDNCPKPSGDD